MATYRETLTVEKGNAALRQFAKGSGLRNSWRSVDPCVFLEIGRLRKESLRLHNGKQFDALKGQITVMTESDWRVEKPRSIHFGSGFSDRRIDKLLHSLKGVRITAICLTGRLPELRIELDDGRVLSTFTNWSNQPQWLIGFHDTRLFDLHSLPPDADINPWLHVRGGHLEVEYCYDEANRAARKFFHHLGRA